MMANAQLCRRVIVFAFVLIFALLIKQLFVFLGNGYFALNWPFEIDYAEGIVWQQTNAMFTPQAYGSIFGFPAIVFHYTPFFHVMTRVIVAMTGFDTLYSARALSLVSTLATAVLVAKIATLSVHRETTERTPVIAGVIGGLCVFSLYPVLIASPVMRSDMFAIFWSFFGFYLGLRAFVTPRLIYAAAICFVAAVFTKQTAIAAPLAIFGMYLWLRPRLAVQGVAVCLILGLVLVLGLSWATSGGFLKHIFLYNLNRISLVMFPGVAALVVQQLPFVACALFVIAQRRSTLKERLAGQSARHATLGQADVCLIGVSLYCATAMLMTLTALKSGSYLNYFVEWLCVIAVLVGMGMDDILGIWSRLKTESSIKARELVLAMAAPAACILQPIGVVNPVLGSSWHVGDRADKEALLAEVKMARGPIISDEMVMLIRGGKPVVWESMIFAELAATGVWDEKPFLDKIRKHEFSMLIVGPRHVFSENVWNAFRAEYPVKRAFGDFTMYLPANNERSDFNHQTGGQTGAQMSKAE